jgi:hypothetical protein
MKGGRAQELAEKGVYSLGRSWNAQGMIPEKCFKLPFMTAVYRRYTGSGEGGDVEGSRRPVASGLAG